MGTVEERIASSRCRLISRYPFFGQLALYLPQRYDDTLPAVMATDGEAIICNPVMLDAGRWNDDEIMGALAHEVLHVALCHHLRRDGRDTCLWNLACDLAVNDSIVRAGLSLPRGSVSHENHNLPGNLSAEEYYSALLAGDRSPSADNLCRVRDGRKKEEDVEEESLFSTRTSDGVRRIISSAVLNLPDGTVPGYLPEEISSLAGPVSGEPEEPEWVTELRRWIQAKIGNARRMVVPPNRRFFDEGLYLPRYRGEGMYRLAILVDSSGSVETETYDRFRENVVAVAKYAGLPEIRLIEFTGEIVRDETIDCGDMPDRNVVRPGTGGTLVAPAFAALNAEDPPEGILVLTDGHLWPDDLEEAETLTPVKEDVLWVCTDVLPDNPFGRAVLARQ